MKNGSPDLIPVFPIIRKVLSHFNDRNAAKCRRISDVKLFRFAILISIVMIIPFVSCEERQNYKIFVLKSKIDDN